MEACCSAIPVGVRRGTQDLGRHRLAGGRIDPVSGRGQHGQREEERNAADVGHPEPHHRRDAEVRNDSDGLRHHQQGSPVEAVGERSPEQAEAEHPKAADRADRADQKDHDAAIGEALDPEDRRHELQRHHALTEDEAGQQQAVLAEPQRVPNLRTLGELGG